jgi:hypothetical protein
MQGHACNSASFFNKNTEGGLAAALFFLKKGRAEFFSAQTERPPGVAAFFQGRIVPTEAKPSKLFHKNLMRRMEQVSRIF